MDEKEIKKQNKKKFEETDNKNRINFDKKKVILILTILLVAIVGVILFLVFNNDDEYKLADVQPTISTLEDGTYYIFGSPNNQSFEVETKEGFTYKVVDEENNDVKVLTTKKDNKVTINAPEELYEEGKNYTLTITNGTFTEEILKEATAVSFSIVRDSKQTSELNKDVKSVSSENNKIVENENKIILTTEEKYKKGDIILVDNNKAYKVENEEDGTYQLSIPTITEVYKEFDYYGSAYLNLSEFEESEEIEEYLVAYAEENIIDKIIPKVNAASKIKVDYKWDKKINGLVAKIHAETDPGDKLFNKSFLAHHKLSFDYEVVIKLKANYDIFFDKYDINFSLEISNKPSFKLETESEALDKIKDGLKAYTAGENAIKLLQSDYDSVRTDTKNLKQSVGRIVAPTPVPGLNAIVDLGLIMDVDLKANMKASLTNTNTITIGLSNKKGLYGNLRYKNKIDASAFGEANMRLGAQVDLGASLLGIVELTGGIKGGIYGKVSVNMESDISKDKISASILATTNAGLFSTILVEAEVLGKEKTFTIFDGEVELYKYELPLSVETDKSKPVIKDEETVKPETGNNSSNNESSSSGNGSNNNNSNNNTENNITPTTPTYRYTAKEVKEKLLSAFDDEFGYIYDFSCSGFSDVFSCYNYEIDIDNNNIKFTNKFGRSTESQDSYIGFTCDYNYVTDSLNCNNYNNATSVLSARCQDYYNNYQSYINQGLNPGDYGYPVEFSSVNECFNTFIEGGNSKNYYKSLVDYLLKNAGLTRTDLDVLK